MTWNAKRKAMIASLARVPSETANCFFLKRAFQKCSTWTYPHPHLLRMPLKESLKYDYVFDCLERPKNSLALTFVVRDIIRFLTLLTSHSLVSRCRDLAKFQPFFPHVLLWKLLSSDTFKSPSSKPCPLPPVTFCMVSPYQWAWRLDQDFKLAYTSRQFLHLEWEGLFTLATVGKRF